VREISNGKLTGDLLNEVNKSRLTMYGISNNIKLDFKKVVIN